jgi:hypothetical protein
VADRLEEIRERTKRGHYDGRTRSLTVIKFEEATWLFLEIERLREDNRRLAATLKNEGKGGPY